MTKGAELLLTLCQEHQQSWRTSTLQAVKRTGSFARMMKNSIELSGQLVEGSLPRMLGRLAAD